MAVGVGWVTSAAGLPELVVGLLVVGTLALGSRGMHLDGLADTVDGLGSGWDRDRALKIMRRGNTGPMGAAALVIMIGLQAASIGRVVVDLPSAIFLGGDHLRLPLRAEPGLPPRRPGGKNQGLGRRRGRFGALDRGLRWPGWRVAVVLGVGQAVVGGSYASGAIAGGGGRPGGAAAGLALRTPARRGDRGRDGRLDRGRPDDHAVGVAV